MTEVVTAELIHSYEVMQRKSVQYDYEKVFWNSTYSLGLLGLSWVAIKLGWIISDLQEASKAVATYAENFQKIISDPIRSLRINTYLTMWDAVIGPEKDVPANNYGEPTSIAVQYYRDNPDQWAIYVEEIQMEYPEIVFNEDGKALSKQEVEARDASPNALKVLEMADGFFTKYGAALPIGVLVGHAGLEYIRVDRSKRELKK